MEFELDKTHNLEFARLEPHEISLVREHIGPHMPESIPVDELQVYEDVFRRKARQASTALDAIREGHKLGARSSEVFVLRGLSSALQESLRDISEYRKARRRQAFADMGEEEAPPPNDAC